jgi:beta-D-xylosidase 4
MVQFSITRLVTAAALAPLVIAALPPDCVNGPLATNKVCDATAEPEERAAALVAAMTSDEKLHNLVRYVVKR